MKTESDAPAFSRAGFWAGVDAYDGGASGLTKREYFAGQFMAALLANPARYAYIARLVDEDGMTNEEANVKNAHKAVKLADALIAALNKPEADK
jgi:hypothetical protein